MIDKETQIKALLGGHAYELACKTLGVDNMKHRKYAEVFTATEAEVYEYTEKHGLPQSEATSKDSLQEGFHYYYEDGKWHCFFRERGMIFDEKTFEDSEQAKKYIVRTLIQLAGTGLY